MEFAVYVLADAFTKYTISLKLDFVHEVKNTLISNTLSTSIFLQAEIFGVTRSLIFEVTRSLIFGVTRSLIFGVTILDL
jgi:hypothetical protein